jgi:hypothetical protein
LNFRTIFHFFLQIHCLSFYGSHSFLFSNSIFPNFHFNWIFNSSIQTEINKNNFLYCLMVLHSKQYLKKITDPRWKLWENCILPNRLCGVNFHSQEIEEWSTLHMILLLIFDENVPLWRKRGGVG